MMIHPQIPNTITVGRLILVPLLIFLLVKGEYGWALLGFTVAGLSDGVDGYLARRFRLESDLGGFLDPIADKVLMVSIYVTLALSGQLPVWLAFLVVARDFLIIGFIMVLVSLGENVRPAPSIYSKVNTAIQVLLVVTVLANKAFSLSIDTAIDLLVYSVAVTTIISGANYYWIWIMQRQQKQ
jgi:cardiolipin synthase